MRIRCPEPFESMTPHPAEKGAALRRMKLCWQRDVIEHQLHTRRLGRDAREPLEDMLSAINHQLRETRNNPSS